MITLSATTHTIQVVGTVSFNFSYVIVSYVDITTTTFSPATVVTGVNNGTTTLVSAPAASTQRQIKYLSVLNADSVANSYEFQHAISGTGRPLFKVTLQPNETAAYEADVGWRVYDSSGAVKVPGSTPYANVMPPGGQRVFLSNLNRSGAAKLLITNTGYFVYVGQVAVACTPKFVELHASGAVGAGAQTAEVGLFSTPAAPNKTAQSLTKLTATGTVDALTSNGVKRNTAAFTTVVAAGTHLWAGMRTAMATTQPTIEGLNFDMGQGAIMTATTPGALTGAGPFTGVLVTASLHGATSDVPDLRVTLD